MSSTRSSNTEADRIINRILNSKNEHEMLGVKRDESKEVIRSKFKKIIVLIHPDKCKNPKAKEATQALMKAAAVLMDTEKEHDAYLESQGTSASSDFGMELLIVAGVSIGLAGFAYFMNWLLTPEETEGQEQEPIQKNQEKLQKKENSSKKRKIEKNQEEMPKKKVPKKNN